MNLVQQRIVAFILILPCVSGIAFAKTNSSTTLASSLNPSTYGASVKFTATVTPSAATGTVTFKDGSTTLGTGTLSSGKATFTTTTLGVGSHSITAVYGGNSTYNGSTSSVLTQSVNKASSTTAASSSRNPSTFGSSVIFTATVTPSNATGTVTFKDGTATLGTGTLSAGKATLNTASLTAGSHPITAVYGGDSNYNSSTSSALSQTVNKATTTTTLASSANPSGYGSIVTFTATVTPSAATGIVTFKDGSTTLGTGTLSGGQATYSTSTLSIGSHSITAAYGGDSNDNSSTSSTLSQRVKQASSVVLSSSANPSPSGAGVTFAASITPTAATGTVTFYDGGFAIGTGTLTAGVATYGTSTLAVGSHSITSVYSGDNTYAGSTSPLLIQSVLILSSISLTPQNVSVPVGATKQFTATGTFSDASVANVTPSVAWTSSDSAVATISTTGIATILDEGPTTIQAALGTVSSSTTLTGTPSRFRLTGSLNFARDSFTATVLQNGKVLIAGGTGYGASFVSTCELYDPPTGSFSKTGDLTVPRFNHTATLLSNGMVLVAGGQASDGFGSYVTTASAELYDPIAGTFSLTSSLNQARKKHTATLLPSGQVLIAGGNGLSGDPAQAELYDPSTNMFSVTGNLTTARDEHTATLLNDGTVLIAGGETYPGGSVLSSAEIFDPIAGTFAITGPLTVASSGHAATLLNSGKVLIAAGTGSNGALSRTELYDPVARSFAFSGRLTTARQNFTATLLSDGKVLLAGGLGTTQFVATGELYDPASGTTSIAGNLNVARGYHAAAALNNGLTLIAGGINNGGQDLSSAETYQSTMTAPPPLSLQITPAVVNMIVGGTQQFTAVDNYGYPRLDVIWTVSDPSLASVTTDEDATALLTALAPGQVTLTATAEGVTAEVQITILSEASFPPGTAVWSAPPPAGFAVQQLAQAVPSANGPDLYSISLSADGTQSIIQALRADGQQLWQKTMPPMLNNAVPDGSGGLIATTCESGKPMTVMGLDATGQPLWQEQSALVNGYGYLCYAPQVAVGGDGTAFIVEPTNAGLPSLTTAYPSGYLTQKQFPPSKVTNSGRTTDVPCCVGPPMVNTDGTMYVEYEVRNTTYNVITSDTLYLYNKTSGSSTVISTTTQDEALLPGPIIPDGQGGLLVTWTVSPSHSVRQYPYQAADVTNGAVGSAYGLPFSPQSVTPFVSPMLVLGENGTAFASGPTTVTINGVQIPLDQVASFNVMSGTPNWTYQAGTGSTLSILGALSDGGVAIRDSSNGVIRINSSGTASPVSTPLAGFPQYSWAGEWYLQGSQGAAGLTLALDVDAANPWATPGGNPGKQSGADSLCECELQTTSSGQQPPTANTTADNWDSVGPLTVANCAICNLSPPSPPSTLTSCTTLPASGPTYLIVVGDSGTDHNVHQGFNLAAQQNAIDLQARGNNVIACRISTATDLNNALTKNGHIGGGIIYYGHSGHYRYSISPEVILSILAIGNAVGGDSNLHYYNINELCPDNTCNGILDPTITFAINGCLGASKVSGNPADPSGITQTPIAKVIARRLNIKVTGYYVGTYFSQHNAATATSANYEDEPKSLPEALPMYLIPEGAPGKKKAPACFVAVGECKN